jgi:hypothetical protein
LLVVTKASSGATTAASSTNTVADSAGCPEAPASSRLIVPSRPANLSHALVEKFTVSSEMDKE